MKIKLVIFFILLAHACTFSQTNATLEETKDFIKKYVEAYPQNNGAQGEKSDIAFIDLGEGALTMVYSNYLPYAYQSVYTFSPKNISSVIIDKSSMKGKNCIIKLKLNVSSKAIFSIVGSDTEESKDEVNITLGNASFDENFPERLKKAFEHLVNLMGGKITVDKF